MKSDGLKTKAFLKKSYYFLKWMVLPLALTAVVVTCAVFIMMNTDPVRKLAECREQIQNDTALLNKYMQILAETQSSLKNCQDQSTHLSEKVQSLEKQVKELGLLNTNLMNKQEDLEAAAEKQQEQFNECERDVAKANGQLQSVENTLNQCQQDRKSCQEQLNLHGHASTINGHYIYWIVLSLVALTLLYS